MFNFLKKLFCRNNENKVTLNINTNSNTEKINIEYDLPDSSKSLNIEINLDANPNHSSQIHIEDINKSYESTNNDSISSNESESTSDGTNETDAIDNSNVKDEIDNSSAKVEETTVSNDLPASANNQEETNSHSAPSTSIFNPDQAIESSTQDKLNRANLAKMLADDYLKFSKDSSLAIGIYAKWGSGKTSFLNMLLENIKTQQAHDSHIVIVEFKPWLCSNPTQMVQQFFEQLSNKIEEKTKSRNTIWHKINKYSKQLKALSSVPYVGPLAQILADTAEDKTQDVNLQQTKDNLAEALSKSDLNVLVTIDDIDRLSSDEIVAVFQLVKSIADFPNTIYILAFDHDIVSNVLSKVQFCNGWDYLEKIIQVPLYLPAPTKETVRDILFNELKTIILDFDNEHALYGIINICCENYIFSIRDINRYINVFRLKYDEYRDLLIPVDLIVLTFLQVFEPNLYVQLRDHKNELFSYNSVQDYIAKLTEITQKHVLHKNKFESAITLLSMLFYLYTEDNNTLYHQIANKDIFDAYFSLSKHNQKYPYSTLKTILYNQDNKIVTSEIVNIDHYGTLNNFLSDLSKYIAGTSLQSSLSKDRAQHLLLLIARLMHKLTIKRNFDGSDTYIDFWKCVRNLLITLNSEEQYTNFMCTLFEDEQVTLSTQAHLYDECCFKESNQNITTYKDQIKTILQPIFINKSMKALKSGEVLTYNDLYFVKLIFDKFTDYKLKIQSLLSNLTKSDDFALAKIISLNLEDDWDILYGKYWFLSKSVLDLDREVAYSRISNFLSSDQFNKLEGSFQEAAIAYLILYEKIKADSPEDVVKVYFKEVRKRMQALGILQQDKAE